MEAQSISKLAKAIKELEHHGFMEMQSELTKAKRMLNDLEKLTSKNSNILAIVSG